MSIIEFVPANGFVAESYQAFLQHFSPHHRVQYRSVYGHSLTREGLKNWRGLTQELLMHLRSSTREEQVIGIGHSMGGVLLLQAYEQVPEKFSKLFIIDAPIFHPVKQWLLYCAQVLGVVGYTLSPARKTRRRKRRWGSEEEMRGYFSGRSFFRSFSPASLEHYITHGTKRSEEGITLRFSPSVEYEIFKSIPAFFKGAQVTVPAYYLYSTQHAVLTKRDIRFLMRNTKGITFIPCSGGHLFPLEAPAAAAELVKSLMHKEDTR